MKKQCLSLLLVTILLTPALSFAQSSAECAPEKSLAGHIHKMILGGANLDQVLTLFSNQNSAQIIAKSLFSNVDRIGNERDAVRLGLVICKLQNHA